MRAHAEGLETISAGLAHEIHNPLNFIKNANLVIAENVAKLQQALARRPADADRAAVIEQGPAADRPHGGQRRSGVERIEKVVELLRRYAREGFPTEPATWASTRRWRRWPGWWRPAGDVEATVEPGPARAPGCRCAAIPEELNQVMRSLVQNAVEAVGPGRPGQGADPRRRTSSSSSR